MERREVGGWGEKRQEEMREVFEGGAVCPSADGWVPLRRPYKVWRHTVGQAEHALVFEESDEAFYVGISKSRSEEMIFIGCGEGGERGRGWGGGGGLDA